MTASSPAQVLFVCTANTGRSALADALLRRRVQQRGLPADVSSAGHQAHPGEAVSPLVVEVAAHHGGDLTEHRSRELTVESLRAADLVLAMASEHREHVVRLLPAAAERTFLLRELVTRVRLRGARRPDEPLPAYLGAVAAAPMPEPASGVVDVADPYGQPVEVLWATAAELDRLIEELVRHLFPAGTDGPAAADTVVVRGGS